MPSVCPSPAARAGVDEHDGNVTSYRVLSAEALTAGPPTVELDAMGAPRDPLAVLDLTALGSSPDVSLLDRLQAAVQATDLIVIGRCDASQVEALLDVARSTAVTVVPRPGNPTMPEAGDPHTVMPGANALDLPASYVATADVDSALDRIAATVRRSPRASLLLARLLRQSEQLSVRDALNAESIAYSMLLAGPEFAAWQRDRIRREDPGPARPAVAVSRHGDQLRVSFDRPERHNAFGRWVRDAACEALDLALIDATISEVVLTGEGASFCSGGDLDEFGLQSDVVAAHLIRMKRSVGWRLHQLANRTTAVLHGACIGAGLELPAFAGQVGARPGTWFQLPELGMGLIPGAGGTVSLPRRIGRWRTAWLVLSGASLPLDDAVSWGLVDQVVAQ